MNSEKWEGKQEAKRKEPPPDSEGAKPVVIDLCNACVHCGAGFEGLTPAEIRAMADEMEKQEKERTA